MTKTNIFDLTEAAAARTLENRLRKALKKKRYSRYLEITAVAVVLDKRRRTFVQRIEYSLFNDHKRNILICSDCLSERTGLDSTKPFSVQLSDEDLSHVDYHAKLLSQAARQARKAYRVYRENRRETLIPILMRVLP